MSITKVDEIQTKIDFIYQFLLLLDGKKRIRTFVIA